MFLKFRGFGLLVNVNPPPPCDADGVLTLFLAFFQGLYIDHDVVNGTMGFATLKMGAVGNATSTTSSATSTPTLTTSTKPSQPTSGASQMQATRGLILGALILAAYVFI
jgi:hypothetical protein